jgi:hypothetical protein
VDSAIGVVVGYGIVRLISDGYWLLTRREGMGYGDGKLLAVIGALLAGRRWSSRSSAAPCWDRSWAWASCCGSAGAARGRPRRRRGGGNPHAPRGDSLRPVHRGRALAYLFLQQQIGVQVDLFLHP